MQGGSNIRCHLKKIISLSELKDTGDAGQNYALNNAGTIGIVNGFGHGANTNANNKKSDADYHFKALISEAGVIEKFVVCDGKKYATYKDGEFEVTKSTCTDNHIVKMVCNPRRTPPTSYELGRIYHHNHAPIYQLIGIQKIK